MRNIARDMSTSKTVLLTFELTKGILHTTKAGSDTQCSSALTLHLMKGVLTMKNFAATVILALSFTTAYAQHGFPQYVEETMSRVEEVFNTADMKNLRLHLPSGMRMRIEETEYPVATDVFVLEQLQNFLAGKESLKFKFTGGLEDEVDARHTSGVVTEIRFAKGQPKETIYVGTGELSYMNDGQPGKAGITVWLRGGALVGLDISSTPRGMVFFTSPYN